jgi:adenylate kinase family enzyme
MRHSNAVQPERIAMFRDIEVFHKVNVVGTSGSGKTTFARRLAEILNIPHVEMDELFWGPNWTQPGDAELFSRLKLEICKPSWILDGNYTRTIPIKWPEGDSIIWLDIPFLTTLTRVTRRAIDRIISKRELWPGTGNRETFRGCFCSRDSVILWSIRTHAHNRRKYLRLMQDKKYAHIKFVRLRSSSEARRFLEELSVAAKQSTAAEASQPRRLTNGCAKPQAAVFCMKPLWLCGSVALW